MNASMYRAFRRLGWGFVIILLDIRIVFFDLLPDFIGFIMIASAFQHLSAYQTVFNKAKWVSIAMIFLSIPEMFMPYNVSFPEFVVAPLKLQLYSQAMLALHVLSAYWTFIGLGAMAKQAGQTALLNTVTTRRDFFLVIYVSELIFYPFLLNVEASRIMLLIAIMALSFIVELLFIRLPFRFSKITRHLQNGRLEGGTNIE
ncbi:hypothetical protein AB6A23_24590 [Paenibacillus tarimensis]